MKSPLFPLLALALCALPLRAQDIIGTSDWKSRAKLLPQIAQPGLGGGAQTELKNKDGKVGAVLKIEPQGLPSGTYKVSVTTGTGATPVSIGTFEVSSGVLSGGDVSNVDSDAEPGSAGEVKFSTSLPGDLDIQRVATVSIADNADRLLLKGTFANPSVHANVFASPGVGFPRAAGRLAINATKVSGNVLGSMELSAKNLPTGQSLAVVVDGSTIGSVTADSKGRLNLKQAWNLGKSKKPSLFGSLDPFKLKKISLTSGGNEVLSVQK